MANNEWLCVDIVSDPEVADDLAAELAEALETGVEFTPSGLRVYLRNDETLGEVQSELHTALEGFERARALERPLTTSSVCMAGDDWADQWKAYFKPLRVGRHFLICPTWEEVAAGPQDRVIRMDPGRAFGTGHHETTRLCLEWLEDWAENGRDLGAVSLLDMGTGSGILAIAAALLGTGAVTGLDNDPEAVGVAEENIALNGLSERVRLQAATIADLSGPFDIIVANIQAFPLIEMAPELAHALKRPGRLVLSGILVEQSESVVEAYTGMGLEHLEKRIAGEWCLLVFG